MFLYADFAIAIVVVCLTGVEPAFIRVCENNFAKIDCDNQTISVSSANYGRTVKGKLAECAGNYLDVDEYTKNDSCLFSGTEAIVKQRCDGQKTCEIEAFNVLFGDPCPLTLKYLAIEYSCK